MDLDTLWTARIKVHQISAMNTAPRISDAAEVVEVIRHHAEQADAGAVDVAEVAVETKRLIKTN